MSKPNVNSGIHHHLFNTSNNSASASGVSAGQERILQLDPGIFRDLPTAVELGAEGRQAREQLSTLPAATNRLPEGTQEGYGLQNLIPNRNHNENRQPRRGWDPLADLQQEAHSRNTRRNPEPNSQPGPGLPHHNSSRGNLGLVTQDSGSRHTETRTTEDGTVVTVDTYTTRDGSRVTEEHGSGFHRITIETLTGKRITVQSARGEDGRWVNVGTIREPSGRSEGYIERGTHAPLYHRAFDFVGRARGGGRGSRLCAADAPCGGPSPEELGIEIPTHVRTKSVVERLHSGERPGVRVRPDDEHSTPQASGSHIPLDPRELVVNPNPVELGATGTPEPARFQSRDQVNPGPRPEGL
jgi:hypothetical protein